MYGVSFLSKSKQKLTYEERLKGYSDNAKKAKELVKRNFERFCIEEYEGRSYEVVIKEMSVIFKTDPESVYEVIQKWVNWNKDVSPASLRQYLNNLKTLLRFYGVKLSNEDLKDYVSMPRIHEEDLHPCQVDDVKKLLDVSGFKLRGLYLSMLSSALRPVEVCHIRVKDLDFKKSRIVVHVPAKWTKLKRAKTTFFSKEARPYVVKLCSKKQPSDYVFGGSTSSIDLGLSRVYKRAGFDDKYEHNDRNKITPMSFRSFFITRISRKDPNFAKILAGQKGYLLQYDRLTEDEKLEKYLEFENELLVFDYVKTEDNKELSKRVFKVLSDLMSDEGTIEDARKADNELLNLYNSLKIENSI